jgi:hypothetical protein
MNRASQTGQARVLRTVAHAVAVVAAAMVTAACGVEVGAEYPGGYDDYPPDGYIATTEPVYYNGYASYWYGGRWYYRNGGRWNHYEREPPALAGRRFQAAPARRNYEPSHAGRPAARSRSGGRR